MLRVGLCDFMRPCLRFVREGVRRAVVFARGPRVNWPDAEVILLQPGQQPARWKCLSGKPDIPGVHGHVFDVLKSDMRGVGDISCTPFPLRALRGFPNSASACDGLYQMGKERK
jgi:hypothetical protein